MPRTALLLAVFLLAPMAVSAQQRPAAQPQRLGTHQAWTAATHQEGGQKVCYAFTRAARSEGASQGRGPVTLTVTHRPNGRDQVAVSAGVPYARGAEVVMEIGSQEFRSYATVQSSAFFQGGQQVIGALRGGRDAEVRSPAQAGRGAVTDTFSLSGFTAAYNAISRECPER
jgi:invasion protein IalB